MMNLTKASIMDPTGRNVGMFHPSRWTQLCGRAVHYDGQEPGRGTERRIREYLGEPPYQGEDTLPILIKFIDATAGPCRCRCIPTTPTHRQHENGQLGKTEMWYVLDAGRRMPRLVYGFNRDMTAQRKKCAGAIAERHGDESYLQKVPIHKDDLFFIQAGTVHAIGAGALVAEIQENSNLTYRLYDYDRIGKDGKKRELHIDKALDVANLKSSAEPKQSLPGAEIPAGCCL